MSNHVKQQCGASYARSAAAVEPVLLTVTIISNNDCIAVGVFNTKKSNIESNYKNRTQDNT